MDKLRNSIVCGDCIEILGKVKESFADLIFADPPFNIGYKYDKYYDKVKSKNYIAWTKQWMSVCKSALKPHGSFYIAIGDEYAANVKIIADEIGLHLRNWLIWHYTFGQQTKNKFARSHTHIFYFVNDKKNFTFNDWAVRVPSDRQLIYDDKRANPRGKMPDDVWTEYSRVCGTFNERQLWHPCQMPESLLKRIIAASTNPGELVLDPFIGSGTTAAAAVQLGRDYAGIDISQQYVDNTKKRLKELESKRDNLLLSPHELDEVRRLMLDMSIPARQILNDEKLADIFVAQLNIRMNGSGKLSREKITAALEVLAD
ncbi:MAG: site-specific DNA-methyltransferase [Phycisphaerae bacterium]|jgi:site-specific DNA-methyltransferase (adenine-specific)